MLLRVIISEHEIRRLSIENLPPNVEKLCELISTNLGLKRGFNLQFEDPEFNNQLCNLSDINELPVERATLKILFTADPVLSESSLDACTLQSCSEYSVEWPDPFVIPQFSYDVELQLKDANYVYAKDGSVMTISKGLKTDILDTLADVMFKITAYPNKQQYESVAKALVEKHPCLKEPGFGSGWCSWFYSLKFKLGNYRQKLSAAGCPEVVVNKRKGANAKRKRVKKSRKGEVHYLPDPPAGDSAESVEEKQKLLVTEMQKKDPDLQLVDQLMTDTFSLRRQEIIGDEPPIAEIVTRWPALFTERQIVAEFKRVLTTDLLQSFLDGLDDLVPRLMEEYKTGVLSGRKPALKRIFECLDKENTNERRRTAALLGLPHVLSEDPSDVIRMCDAHGETLDVSMKNMKIGLLIGYEGELEDAFPQDIFNVGIVVEEKIVLYNLKDISCSFAMLMGIIYCLNLEYPTAMKYTFEFLQKVVMKIKPDQPSAKVHRLSNKLQNNNL